MAKEVNENIKRIKMKKIENGVMSNFWNGVMSNFVIVSPSFCGMG